MQTGKVHILIVHRHEQEARQLAAWLESDGYSVTVVQKGEAAYNVLDGGGPINGLIADLRVDEIDGLRVLDVAIRRNPDVCAVMIADRADIELATESMRRGAYDFQVRPLIYSKLKVVLERGFSHQQLVSEVHDLRGKLEERYGFSQIVGNSSAITAMLDRIRQIAPAMTTVLLYGETGTGKELVARAIHEHSGRRDGPFVKLNCAALAESIVESELFGHEKGAFTGAVASRQGRFEAADGGSLFLDEVSEISPAMQVKLLRALEEREIERVGSTKPVKVDVRLLAATNHPLEEKVRQGQFRSDLYYRLRVAKIELPPLRDRKEDIPILIDHFLREFNRLNSRSVTGVTREALQVLVRYDWPGNVRELRNCIDGMSVFVTGRRRLGLADLPDYVREGPRKWPDALAPPRRHASSDDADSPELRFRIGASLRDVDRAVFEATFRHAGFDKKKTAKLLGIGLRTVYKKLHEYGLDK